MFTPRELEFIRMLVERNLTTKEIAGELNISTETAWTHRTNIMRKLRTALHLEQRGVSLVDLVLYAVTHKCVDLDRIYAKYGGSIAACAS